MVRRGLLCLSLVLSSCSRCSGPAPEVDAGPVWYQPLSTAQRERHSSDLRSALMVIYPEYRETKVKGGRVLLTREGHSAGPVRELMQQTFKANGFAESLEDGKLTGTRGELIARLVSESPKTVIDVGLPVTAQALENIYAAPSSMSTQELALYLPRDPKAFTTDRETFEFVVNYEAFTAERARFLVHQAVSLLLKNEQWQPTQPLPEGFADGGLPEQLAVQLVFPSDGSVVEFRRAGAQVQASFRLVTDQARQ